MWPFKKQNSKQQIEEENFGPIIVPISKKTVNEYKGCIDNHNSFNEFIDVDNTVCRVMSEHSHEIMRMTLRHYRNSFERVKVGMNRENSYVSHITMPYVSSTAEITWVKRLFVTDNGKFFYQIIGNDDDVSYFYMTREAVQKDMKQWENPNFKTTPIDTSIGFGAGESVLDPGTYPNKDSLPNTVYVNCWETYIDSYEIIDQKRYDGLIEVL